MTEITSILLEKYISGQSSAEEALQVESWMKENDLTKEQLSGLLTLPEGVKLMLRLSPERDWEIVRKQLHGRKHILWQRLWIRMAASVVLLIGIATYIYVTDPFHLSNRRYTSIKNINNISQRVLLPDSSILYLNEGAEVIYPADFTDQRNMVMKGEVFFEVRPNPEKPFLIDVNKCKVKVIGTSFNIHASKAALVVTVTTGSVSLETPAREQIYLKTGERASYTQDQNKLLKNANKDLNYLSWKTRSLQFSNTPLDEVMTDLEKFFHITVRHDQPLPRGLTYTSYFEKPSLQEVLEEMSQILHLEYKKDGSIVTLDVRK